MEMKSSLAGWRLDDEEEKEENEGWRVDEDVQATNAIHELTLVGCFLTLKAVNFMSMKTTLANL